MRTPEKAICKWCCSVKVPNKGLSGMSDELPVPWRKEDDMRWDVSGSVICPTHMGTRSLETALKGCWLVGLHSSGVLVVDGESDFSSFMVGGFGI